MKKNVYGGIAVDSLIYNKSFVSDETTVMILGEKPYKYLSISVIQGFDYNATEPGRYCIYVLSGSTGVVKINDMVVPIDHYVLGDSSSLNITVIGDQAQLLLVFQSTTELDMPFELKSLVDAKRVDKPWGHEIWLTGDPSSIFAFKRISLKAGSKTSLQYHKFKRETNFVISGLAKFYFNQNIQISPDDFLISDIKSIKLKGPFVADVFPNLIHRLEAVEDLLLYEVSTPELDDVIRLADDAARSNGRVESEHNKNSNELR